MSNLSIKGVIAGDDFLTETILTGLALNENLNEYYIAAQNQKRCDELKKKYNINAVTDFNEFINKTSVLILAFKFEDGKDTLSKLAGKIPKDTLVISIIYDLAMVFIQNFLPENKLIRVTFNPSIISGEGLGAFVAGKNATDSDKKIVREMLSNFAKIVEVSNEDEFERVHKFILANTFLSYVVVKSIVDAAVKNGFSTEQAGFVIDQIMKGASRTLIKYQFEGAEMLKDGLRQTDKINNIVELIKDYGIYDSIERYLTTKEVKMLFDPYHEAEEENFKMQIDWFEKMVSN